MIIVTVYGGNRGIGIRQLLTDLRPDIRRRAKNPAEALDILQGLLDAEVDHPEAYE